MNGHVGHEQLPAAGALACSGRARTGSPIRVDENSASHATGHTQPAKPRTRAPAEIGRTRRAGRPPESRRRRGAAGWCRRGVPRSRAVSGWASRHVTISARDGPRRTRSSAPSVTSLDPAAPDGHWVGELEADAHHHHRVPALLSPHRPGQPRPRARRRRATCKRRQIPDGGWSLFEGGPVRISRRPSRRTSPEDGRRRRSAIRSWWRARERIREMGGPAKARRVHQDPAGAVRRVRLERRAHDARRDHAAAAPVLPVQHLRGLVLVAHA